MKWLRSGIFLVVLITTVRAAPTLFADEDDPLRLPTNSAPISYDLTLTTNVHEGTIAFSGTVKIEIEIKENSDTLTLQNNGLTISTVTLSDSSEIAMESTYDEELDLEFVHVSSVSRQFYTGETVFVVISFTGQLSTGTSGFYRSSYSVDGQTR